MNNFPHLRKLATPLSIATLIAGCLIAVPAASAAAGLDPTFDGDGYTVTDEANYQTTNAVAPTADGRVVAAGMHTEGAISKLVLRRYTATGAVDTSFGANGVSRALVGNSIDGVSDLVIQPDGKLLVAVNIRTGSGATAESDVAIIRLSATGIYDGTFGARAVARITAPATSELGAEMSLRPDGRILLSYASNGAPRVARFTALGAKDLSFGTAGVAAPHLNPQSPFNRAGGLAVQADGTILQAANVTYNAISMGAVLKYSANGGAADSTYFGNTFLTSAADVTLKETDVLVAGVGSCPDYSPPGNPNNAPSRGPLVVNYKADGSLRPTFGSGGVTTLGCSANYMGGNAAAVEVLPGGTIGIAGAVSPYATKEIPMMWRLTRYGTLDASFGTDGQLALQVGARTGTHSDYRASHDLSVSAAGALVAIDAYTRSPYDPFTPGDQDIAVARVKLA